MRKRRRIAAAKKRAGKRRGVRSAARRQGGEAGFPPGLPPGGEGLAARVTIAQGAGGDWRVAERRVAAVGARRRDSAAGEPSPLARRLTDRVDLARLAAVLSAAGSEHRLKLLVRLLAGPAVYRELSEFTGLAAGPLYHHLSALRLALLILPKRRNTYELTPAGRNLVLALAALAPLLANVRTGWIRIESRRKAKPKAKNRKPKTETHPLLRQEYWV